jgi:hypothetical protein
MKYNITALQIANFYKFRDKSSVGKVPSMQEW